MAGSKVAHAVLLREFERGLVNWENTARIDRIRREHTQKHVSTTISGLKIPNLGFVLYCVFILSAISPYTTGIKGLFNQSTAQVQPQLTSN